MKVNTRTFAVMVLAIYWGLILMSMATGIWDSADAQQENSSFLPVEEIHGTMTVQELLDTYNIDKEIFYTVFKIDFSEPTTLPLRDIVHKYGFEVQNVRDFVEAYLKDMQLYTESTVQVEDSCNNCSTE